VAEGARLESVYTGNRIVGSNPTPSAKSQLMLLNYLLFLLFSPRFDRRRYRQIVRDGHRDYTALARVQGRPITNNE
jgi:hypothetical protein